ncbi:hypothetical protein Wildcat_95 [Mycobacterium phage Wildcat]|uniref:Uncharacterized protein n=3 Tax=Mycobacterium virus Wildcat TaxID=1993859 RepID=Q19XW5_9CAUD|nr:hypothetical protein Wildcat_95 [Mycobacterium phage Wildcat]ABE67700.1 hypothetical protein Wildcat_95 [Mycobacterium phage Wildcat]AJD82165.1 hypothetical protein COSMO_93 [Mycobacterium phage Cosmo]QGJ89982.1 hypothetical protein PBI_MARYV_95 [Mycobacterium phage MaryV]WKR36103.1 hypothetical protein [Mycobacterium phage Azrael100]
MAARRNKLREVKTSVELAELKPFSVILLGNSERPDLGGIAVQRADEPDAWYPVRLGYSLTTGDIARFLHEGKGDLNTAFVVYEGVEQEELDGWDEVLHPEERADEGE